MKKIVITGATSFIGCNTINELLKEDNQIFAVIRPNSKKKNMIPKNHNITILEIDMENINTILNYIRSADAFLHLAWEGARGIARNDLELQKKNVEAGLSAVKAAADLGCKVFVGCGSQAEYGKQGSVTTEESQDIPDTAYGSAKKQVYIEGGKIAEKSNIRFVWPRIFSIYGFGDFEGTLINSAIKKMLNNETIDLSECTQNWDFLHVIDAARALSLFLKNEDAKGVYNIASGETHQLRWFLEKMKKILNSESKLNFGAILPGPNGVVGFCPKVCKLKSLGWDPTISFDDGIKELTSQIKMRNNI